MTILKRENTNQVVLPGRAVHKAVGKDGASQSAKMTLGFARYAEEYGPMEPHHHAEEALYIIDAKDGWVRFGHGPDDLGEPVTLEPGMILHVPELEWHVFECGKGGYVEVLFFYAQVDNIRPEEIEA